MKTYLQRPQSVLESGPRKGWTGRASQEASWRGLRGQSGGRDGGLEGAAVGVITGVTTGVGQCSLTREIALSVGTLSRGASVEESLGMVFR